MSSPHGSSDRMERRLAAILSADVQGYSRLMEDDDEHTVRTLTTYRIVMTELIRQHRGRVVDSPGDNVLAEFASVVDAVHSAVAIQTELKRHNASLAEHRRMVFRIGINLGDVIVDGERLYGDGVNLAARLESLADGGGICLSGTVYDQVVGKLPFAFEDLGEREVKNIALPVRVYKVQFADAAAEPPEHNQQAEKGTLPLSQVGEYLSAASPPPHFANGPSNGLQIVGRESELSYLNSCLETVLRGERQIVFIAGELGMGKTALVDAFLEQIDNRAGVWVARGHCVEHYGAGEAYLPLLEASRDLCRGPDGTLAITALKKYAPTWLRQLSGLVSETEFDALPQQVPGATQERMLREMAEVAEILTTEHACIVVLEDLHWSDISTLEWLAYIARRREPAQLLILATYRPTDTLASDYPLKGVVQELQGRGRCEELRLKPLTEDVIAEYVSSHFPDVAFSPTTLRSLQRRTGGNALFVVAMVESLMQQGGRLDEHGQTVTHEGGPSATEGLVPESLRQLIEKQIDALSEEEKRLLESASIVGTEFSVAAAVAGLQDSVELAEERCERLARSGQVLHAHGTEEWPDGTLSGRYGFRNALYRDVLYDRIAAVRKARWHKRIGERKAQAFGQQTGEIAAELSVHFEAGRDFKQAVVYRQQAGERAVQGYAHQEAVHHVKKGLALLQTFPESVERVQQELAFQIALGVSLSSTQGFGTSDVEQAFTQAGLLCDQLPGSPELFPVLYGLWNFYFARAEFSGSEMDDLAARMQSLAQETRDTALSVGVASSSTQALFHTGQFQAAADAAEQGIAHYDRKTHADLATLYGEDPGVVCRAYAALTYWMLGYPDRARQYAQDGVLLAQELNQPMSVAQALLESVIVHQFRKETHTVAEQTQRLLHLGEEQSFPLWTAGGLLLSGWVQAQQGQTTASIDALRQGLEIWRATGTETARPYYLSLLAEIYGQAGQVEHGLTTVTAALAAVQDTQEHCYAAELHRLKGELLLQQFKVQGSRFEVTGSQPLNSHPQTEAENCFHKALEIARQQQARSFELRAAVGLGRLWQLQGKVEEAQQLVAEVYAWFTEGFDTKDLQDAAAFLSDLGGQVQQPQREEAQEPSVMPREDTAPLSAFPDIASPLEQFPDPEEGTTTPAPLAASQTQEGLVFHQEGEYWTLVFQGTTCRIKDTRGVQYLARLLAHPEQEFHAMALASGSAEPSVGQVPSRAVEERSDVEQTTLSSERARVNVTRAIRTAIKRIHEGHPALGEYLTQTVKTGAFCVYVPMTSEPIA